MYKTSGNRDKPCDYCEGTGKVDAHDPRKNDEWQAPCGDCNGTGWSPERTE